MALRPELMMVDYSPIQQAAQTFTTGMQNRRMKQVEGLAGQALMGDPSAMQNLSQLDPMMAAKVQSQLGEQQAAQQQAQYQNEQRFADQQKEFFKGAANAKNVEDLNRYAQFAFQQGLFPEISRKLQEQGLQGFDEEDLLSIKLINGMQGGSGFAGMEFKDLLNIYEKNPVVQDFLGAKNSVLNIRDSYEALKKNPKDQAAQFAVAKAAIQMIESGVVRPEEFSAAAGIALPKGMSPTEAMDYLYTRISDGLTFEQATNLANMGRRAYNAKVQNVRSLQEDMMQAGLGQHNPEVLFSTASAEELPDFVSGQKEGNVLTDAMKEITSKAEYDALPSGARYIQNGIEYLKK